MVTQLSNCCKADIVITWNARPNAFACKKCSRIIWTDIKNIEDREPRVSQDGLSRNEKIWYIYDTIWCNKYILDATNSECGKFATIMIWDMLDWLYQNKGWSYVLKIFPTLSIERIEMRKPIEKQCSDCIEYVYSLID